MKKLILFLLIFIGISYSLFSQKIYKEFDVWENKISDDDIVSLKAYITVDSILTKENVVYQYQLFILSLSKSIGSPTITWLYGTRIFIDNVEVSNDIYPDGFMVAVPTTPLSVYKYKSPSTKLKFSLTWEKAIADPRQRK